MTPKHAPAVKVAHAAWFNRGQAGAVSRPCNMNAHRSFVRANPEVLQQILGRLLVKDVLVHKDHRTVGLHQLPIVRIDGSDDGTFARWMGSRGDLARE